MWTHGKPPTPGLYWYRAPGGRVWRAAVWPWGTTWRVDLFHMPTRERREYSTPHRLPGEWRWAFGSFPVEVTAEEVVAPVSG